MGIGLELLQAAPQIIAAVGSAVTGTQVKSPSPAAKATVAANEGTKGSDQPADPASISLIGQTLFEKSRGGKAVTKEEFGKDMEGKPGLQKAYKQLISNGILSDDTGFVVWKGNPSYDTDERIIPGPTNAEGKSSSATVTSTHHGASPDAYVAAYEKDFGYKPNLLG